VIIDALRQWNCLYQNHYQGFIAIRRRYYDNEWMMQNITMAMFDENITFYNKYFKRVHFEHFIYKNFNENLSVLFMLGIYSLLVWFDLPVQVVILLFGCFVIITMALVIYRHQKNQSQYDSLHLIGEEKHPHP
jgi:hypothetical protein